MESDRQAGHMYKLSKLERGAVSYQECKSEKVLHFKDSILDVQQTHQFSTYFRLQKENLSKNMREHGWM